MGGEEGSNQIQIPPPLPDERRSFKKKERYITYISYSLLPSFFVLALISLSLSYEHLHHNFFFSRASRVRFNLIFNLLTKLRERKRESWMGGVAQLRRPFFPPHQPHPPLPLSHGTPLPAPKSPSYGINPKKNITNACVGLVLCCCECEYDGFSIYNLFFFWEGERGGFPREKKKKEKKTIKNRYKTHPRLCLPLVATKYSMVLGHTSIQVFVEDQILTRGRVFSRTFHVFSTLAILCFSFR